MLRRRRRNIARPPLSPRVSVQSELRNHQRASLHVQQRPVHLSLLVLENPQVGHFFRHRRRHLRSIFLPHSKQDHQSRANLSRDPPFHRYLRAAHSLHYRSHDLFFCFFTSFLPSSPASAAAVLAIPPHCKQTQPALARLPSNPPSAHDPEHPLESGASCHSPPLPARTRNPAHPPCRTAHGRTRLRSAKMAP